MIQVKFKLLKFTDLNKRNFVNFTTSDCQLINRTFWQLRKVYKLYLCNMIRCAVSINWIMCLMLGLTINSLIPATAFATHHIKVTREILLESGISATPEVIVQTHDGGYVVAGTIGQAWVTRIDAYGKVLWRYAMQNTISWFHGAVMLADDSVILCGEIKDTSASRPLRISGLLTHLDNRGKILSEKKITPNDGKEHGLTYLNSCLPLKDGVGIFGATSNLERGRPALSWFVALDNNGAIKYEKLSDDTPNSRIILLPDQSFYSHAQITPIEANVSDANKISKIDPQGKVEATRVISINSFPVQSITRDPIIYFLAEDGKNIMTLNALNYKLEVIRKFKISVEVINVRRAFTLPDHSLVLFGNQKSGEGAVTASMEWISANLDEKESYIFDPRYASFTALDAIPTGRPREFVTTRFVVPTQKILGANETRHGALLTFIQVN